MQLGEGWRWCCTTVGLDEALKPEVLIPKELRYAGHNGGVITTMVDLAFGIASDH